jgi:hypothetical protein
LSLAEEKDFREKRSVRYRRVCLCQNAKRGKEQTNKQKKKVKREEEGRDV